MLHALSSQKLSPPALLAYAYVFLCGGPYGIELAVASGGALAAIAGLVVFAALWALPQALLAAELTAAFPEAGTVVVWMTRGVGRRWAAVGAGCFAASQILDVAVWPGQVAAYGAALAPALTPGSASSAAAQIALVVLVTGANLLGVGVVAAAAAASLAVTIVPFFVLPFVALARGVPFDASAVVATPPLGPAPLASLASILLWTFQGFFSVANVAGSARDPQTAFPPVLLAVTALIVLTYALPIAYGVMLVPADEWAVGSLAAVGAAASPAVGTYVTLGAVCGNLMGGLAGTQLYALFLARVARSGLLPLGALGRALAWSRGGDADGPPTGAVLFLGASTLALMFLDFSHVVATDTLLNLAGFCVVAVSFLRLRAREPDLPRPFRVPCGDAGARAVGGLCLAFAAVMTAVTAAGEWYAVVATAAVAVALYFAAGHAAERPHDDGSAEGSAPLIYGEEPS